MLYGFFSSVKQRRRRCIATAALMASVIVSGRPVHGQTPAAVSSTPAKPSGIVATVNGTAIFRRDVERDVANALQGQTLPPDQLARLQASALQTRIDAALKQSFLTAQQITATKEEVDAGMDQLRGELRKQKTTLEEFLARSKLTETAMRQTVAEQLAWNKFVVKNMTEQNLEAFFKRFHELFDGSERRVSHILIRPSGNRDQSALGDAMKQAEGLREKIKAGEISFETAAEKHSAGPSRLRGGDLGFIPPKGVMLDQFSEAAFAVTPGDISPPVVTPFGIHLIKVTDTKPGTKSLKEVTRQLQAPFSQALSQQLITEQRQAAKIEFADDFPHFKPGTTELAGAEAASPP